MTPVDIAGMAVGKYYRTLESDSPAIYILRPGSIVELVRDDGSLNPYFECIQGDTCDLGTRRFINIRDVVPLTSEEETILLLGGTIE